MQAGLKLQDGGRIDIETDKAARRVRVELQIKDEAAAVKFTCTLSEARAISSAIMGAAAEA